MKSTSFLFAVLTLLLVSCKKEREPYVIFKNSDYKELKTKTVEVDQGAHYYLVIENGYKMGSPSYAIQKNNEPEQIISDSTMVSIEKHGWNGQQGLVFQIVRIHLDFSSNLYNAGDRLTVYSRHGNLGESVVFVVK